ncbi:Lsr2 family protein [Galbitalea sp. SE-J8]|uniref:histone-like nucleoid-structuring protein Lsr2 n=1 Tax=Galbitalea sp. SE-J8 TaxID=3054952 RepID=UPI00259CDB3A|nr:Lsr2 family protein [Galbitalea sp. SE-J8]MDM4764316.1 Lsr2 family protein [Galbitalea sp. SE-J8]
MAQKTIIQLVDDLDGTSLEPGTGATVRFSLEGTEYEIDLSNENVESLHRALADFVKAGRVISRSRGRGAGTSRRSSGSGIDSTAVRVWAKDNGITVSERGRISADVIEKYNAAH